MICMKDVQKVHPETEIIKIMILEDWCSNVRENAKTVWIYKKRVLHFARGFAY